jgi:predicted ATPase
VARIRHIEIANFRCLQKLVWRPEPGINCLVGPGDSGKSTILDAIDVCLSTRRNLQFADADFHLLDVNAPISISITIGDLNDALKSMDAYGLFVRGFDAATGAIEDEPGAGLETALTLKLTVGSDLEPIWTLVSDRAAAQGQSRYLSWSDRLRLAPTHIGVRADYNLSWRRGSVLNQLSDERADASAALVKAARDARTTFGDEAEAELGQTLGIVAATARELGIPVGDNLRALLDAHSVSFSGGTISLHNADGVPLRGLGTGSTRLLTAGLQRKAADQSTILLMDELEHGLEPHRIIRLLGSIGAKEKDPPLQAFVTTHSPIALQELSAHQLMVVRKMDDCHEVLQVSSCGDLQGTVRACPDAFLASSVVVCEGASEVGFIRGLDQYYEGQGYSSATALGVALVDAGGCDWLYHRVNAFRALRYRTAVVQTTTSNQLLMSKRNISTVEARLLPGSKAVHSRMSCLPAFRKTA